MVLKKQKKSSKDPRYKDLILYHSLSSTTEAQSSDDRLSFHLLSELIIHKTLSVSSNLKFYIKSWWGESGYIIFKAITSQSSQIWN